MKILLLLLFALVMVGKVEAQTATRTVTPVPATATPAPTAVFTHTPGTVGLGLATSSHVTTLELSTIDGNVPTPLPGRCVVFARKLGSNAVSSLYMQCNGETLKVVP